MKTSFLFLGFVLLVSTLSWAQNSRVKLNDRVYSSRYMNSGTVIAFTSADKATVLFDHHSKPSKNVWVDELGPQENCDADHKYEYCPGDAVEYTLTLSGNPARGIVLERFHMTEVTIIGRVFTTYIYRIQFATKEGFLNRQYLRALQ